MNPISNIWKHPRTSAAGLLIAVVTIAGAFSQQGAALGTAGATIVPLVGAAATALLGLLARDPASQPASKSATKLSAWLMIVLLLPLPWIEGCSGTVVAQDIVNWTPSLQSAVATVDSTAALLAPADAPVFSAATAGFDTASDLLVNQARAYLANPSAGTLAQLQTQIVILEQQVNTALLAAGKIVHPASQQHALAAIQAVATIVTAILALVQSVSSKTAVAQMASAAKIKLAAVQPYLDPSQAVSAVACHYGEPIAQARMQMTLAEKGEIRAGF
jgi:hypothetical protein